MKSKASRIPIEEYNKIMKEIEEEYERNKSKEHDLDDIFIQVKNYIRYILSEYTCKDFPFDITKETPGCFFLDISQFTDIKSELAISVIEKIAKNLNGLYLSESLESIYSKLCNMFEICPLLKNIISEAKESNPYSFENCLDSIQKFKVYIGLI
jgi:hypothetical protein